jgi:hypothetical protein
MKWILHLLAMYWTRYGFSAADSYAEAVQQFYAYHY